MENAEKRITITNATGVLLYVGSEVVPPGETRDFPESSVPPHLRPAAATAAAVPEPQTDPIAELLKKSAEVVIGQIRDRSETGAPVLSDEALKALEARETEGKARKTVLAAISEETLKRANERAEVEEAAKRAEAERKAFAELIQAMDDEELAAQRELVKDDAALVALVEEEQQRRAGE